MTKSERKALLTRVYTLLHTGISKDSQQHFVDAYKDVLTLMAGDGLFVLSDSSPTFPDQSKHIAELTKPRLAKIELIKQGGEHVGQVSSIGKDGEFYTISVITTETCLATMLGMVHEHDYVYLAPQPDQSQRIAELEGLLKAARDFLAGEGVYPKTVEQIDAALSQRSGK